jgi:RNA polymerase sigma factor (sigma-70 family)
MFRIIERECYRLFRARSRLRALDYTLEKMLQQDPLPVELRKDLTAAIASLPPIYREMLILRDIDELTAPEAADHLKISIDAAKSRLHRARQMMREHLLASGYLAVEP